MAFQYPGRAQHFFAHEVSFSVVSVIPGTSSHWVTSLHAGNHGFEAVELITEVAPLDGAADNFHLETAGQWVEDSSIVARLAIPVSYKRQIQFGDNIVALNPADEPLFRYPLTGENDQNGSLIVYAGRVMDKIDTVTFYNSTGVFQTVSYFIYNETDIDDDNTLKSTGVGQQTATGTVQRVTPRAFTKTSGAFGSNLKGSYVTFRDAAGAQAWRIGRTRSIALVLDGTEEFSALTAPQDVIAELFIVNLERSTVTMVPGERRTQA